MTIILSSCDRFVEDNYSFPKHVVFTADGGTQIFDGGTQCSGFVVYENYSEPFQYVYPKENEDSLTASCEWMTAKMKRWGSELTIFASPNISNKSRYLTIEIYTDAFRYGIIKVKQEGKKR